MVLGEAPLVPRDKRTARYAMAKVLRLTTRPEDRPIAPRDGLLCLWVGRRPMRNSEVIAEIAFCCSRRTQMPIQHVCPQYAKLRYLVEHAGNALF